MVTLVIFNECCVHHVLVVRENICCSFERKDTQQVVPFSEVFSMSEIILHTLRSCMKRRYLCLHVDSVCGLGSVLCVCV